MRSISNFVLSPQLKLLPRTVGLRTEYEARGWIYQVQHGSVWGSQEFSLAALYSAPPALELGNQTLKGKSRNLPSFRSFRSSGAAFIVFLSRFLVPVQISCVPRRTSLELSLVRSARGRVDSVLLDWTRHGRLEQVRVLSSWSQSEDGNETRLELKQPFSSTLSQMFLQTQSQSSEKEQRSSQQTHLSWIGSVPVNVSFTLNKQWQRNASRGQACALFWSQQAAVSSVKSCVSVGREGNSYSQNAELRWDNRSVKQALKYQRGPRGMHGLQVNVGLDKVSPAPCPSHTLLAKVQTNLRDRLEHVVLLGLCPPQPTLSWSGSHRVNSGPELLYSQTRLAVSGRPHHCSVTFAVSNSSTPQRSNISLFSESRMGNWSVELEASALSWSRGSGVQVQTRLDHRERMWLNGTLQGRCLQTTAGFMNGPDPGPGPGPGPGQTEAVTVEACVEANHSLRLNVQKRDGDEAETVASVFLGPVNQRLALTARGCLDRLAALEARLRSLSSQLQRKLQERIQTVQHRLVEFRQQSRDSVFLQELAAVLLLSSQRVEALLPHRDGGSAEAEPSGGALHHAVADVLPRVLGLLQHASLLGQQELRRPLATLAGVYQDVKGQRLEALWREAVSQWTDGLLDVLPAVVGNPKLSPLAGAGVASLSAALDVAGQQTYHWVETRLATALSGVRKRLASLYRYSPRECSLAASVPLPSLPWSRVAEAGLVEVLLEEWLLRPLQSLASLRPVAELYRLKRRIMDSPFRYEALLVADQFVVTFDGRLLELPRSCPLLLAHDLRPDPAFTLLLPGSGSPSFLQARLDDSTVSIQHDGQVTENCAVQSGLALVQVSNQNGASLSCDLLHEVCSFSLDGWLHGSSTGLFGTNDNEAGNDFPLPDGSQAGNTSSFFSSWQMKPECVKPSEHFPKAAKSPVSCHFLFSSPDSPLSSCFRVVDPAQFLSVCELSSSRGPCRLASAFVHLCQQNHIPLEVPTHCLKA